jgi:hypothetical protein
MALDLLLALAWLGAPIGALLGPQAGAGAADPFAARAELGEGPLQNDVFLPSSREAEQELARGDEVYAGLLKAERLQGAQRGRPWLTALEPWHSALALSRPGDAVVVRPWKGTQPDLDTPWPDPDGTAGGGLGNRPMRRTESVEDAVLRRLLALPADGQQAWLTRFSGLANDELAAAHSAPALLASVERLHPGTPGAGRAALMLAERELELGTWELARSWLERAERHAAYASDAGLQAAVSTRSELARTLARSRTVEPRPMPASARDLEFLAEIPLEDLGDLRRFYLPRPGIRVQPDAAWAESGLAVIQTEERALVLDLADGRRVADFEPIELAARSGIGLNLREPPRLAPGWNARAAIGNGRLVLALCTSPPALLCVSRAPGELFTGLETPRLEWAIAGGERVVPARSERAPLAGWPAGRVQPGPLVLGGCAYVQVHEPDGEGPDAEAGGRAKAHLVCLDLADGSVRWSRLLARGAPIAERTLRLRGDSGEETAALPLERAGERILAVTHLGAAALVDACDGRLVWSFAYRRRPGHGERWSASMPAILPEGVLIAPADSDRAYWLRGAPDLEGRGVLLQPPLWRGEAEALLGGDARRAVVLARSGRERALAEWDGADGSQRMAPWLAPGETFTGLGALSSERALFATDRALYLHDRGRELYLLDAAKYPRPFPAAGGRVVARGERALVIGPHMAWLFSLR